MGLSEEGTKLVIKVKRNVKTIVMFMAILFVVSVVGMLVRQASTGYAAAATSKVGKVNQQELIAKHPDVAKAKEAMQKEMEQAKAEFDAKAASMNEKDKQDYYTQIQQRFTLKQQELMDPIYDKVTAAIKEVADAKGLAVIVDGGNVVYGGQDITEDVLKKITGK